MTNVVSQGTHRVMGRQIGKNRSRARNALEELVVNSLIHCIPRLFKEQMHDTNHEPGSDVRVVTGYREW